jgi:clathrin heavy chain
MWIAIVGIVRGRDGFVAGFMDVYSKKRLITYQIQGHAATFGRIRFQGEPSECDIFAWTVRTRTAELHIMRLDKDQEPTKPMKTMRVYFGEEADHDFPTGIQIAERYGVVYIVTKFGFIHIYDIETGHCFFMHRISSETIFTTCANSASTGILGINRKGQVLSVALDENTLIPYLQQDPANEKNQRIATKMITLIEF